MKKTLLSAILFLGIYTNAQISTLQTVTDWSNQMNMTKDGNEIKNIEGKQYFDENFYPVTVEGYNTINPSTFRYNAYKDLMEFKQNGKIYELVKIDGLILNFPSKKYQNLNYNYDNNNTEGYLVLLVNKKIPLYKREKIILDEGIISSNTYNDNTKKNYRKLKDIFLIKIDNKFYKFPKSSKDLSSLPHIDTYKVDEFIKQNKLNYSKESDIIKITEFINENQQ
ncbi:hypothetical protein CMT92_04435 [Elizabethkingia anophelis]|uniref:Uncharacterized protein n=1 Tax=Elizabethkingia anophelis NUHP1 TaxID=1338011 RepID=A0A077EPU1_9FLAO|nr:hypothetical protein [Elizabethkingia anophelis]AIL47560.1 hypothetical protein BD94_3785 [Elizabethkingia anophelis NUHP1]MBE9393143.1 hypothetical protein [Elizabethkingia anophelis]MBE9408206.1 hypothetical protein [Elizabethkingia anophelis]MBG0505189.1 hypothetical protein [Elizabethkingia anophelis]MCT3815642.1 hypothetical protein [Elizabethkingia anophelis]